MAKDYFQDIVPPGDGAHKPAARKLRVAPPEHGQEHPSEHIEEPPADQHISTFESDDDFAPEEDTQSQNRGIRSINMPTRPRYRTASGDVSDVATMGRSAPSRAARGGSRLWIWVIAILSVAVLGFLATFLFRQTTVTITPRTQNVTFDQTSQFIAYPSISAATGTLAYTVAATDLTESETVAGNGTTATQTKASGSVTVYNSYSASSVKLIKNTRFQTSSGLVFRTPTDIVVPGRQGTTPGHVTATVQADQTGPQYNGGPFGRMTVPGLQSTPAMYSGIYAQSTAAIGGGTSGTQEGVAANVRQAAVSDIRARLTQKASAFVQSVNTSSNVAFSGLTEITFTDMPDSDATSSQVLISESAHVAVPVFAADAFAADVAQAMAIGATDSPLTLSGGSGFGAQPSDATPVNLGSDSVDFALVGSAQFMWNVDTAALTKALAGRDQSAFQTIVGGFPGIDSAKARIEPFWKNTFPSDPSAIKVVLTISTSSQARRSQ